MTIWYAFARSSFPPFGHVLCSLQTVHTQNRTKHVCSYCYCIYIYIFLMYSLSTVHIVVIVWSDLIGFYIYFSNLKERLREHLGTGCWCHHTGGLVWSHDATDATGATGHGRGIGCNWDWIRRMSRCSIFIIRSAIECVFNIYIYRCLDIRYIYILYIVY